MKRGSSWRKNSLTSLACLLASLFFSHSIQSSNQTSIHHHHLTPAEEEKKKKAAFSAFSPKSHSTFN
jgi:hypothetical protein